MSVNIYEEIGVRPFINAGGWMYTRASGITVRTALLQPGKDQIVGKRLRKILTGG
jgi:hypothetical protein